jgi:spermidine synthase
MVSPNHIAWWDTPTLHRLQTLQIQPQPLHLISMQATISEHLGTRYLHLGTPWVQGAMQIRKPDKLVLEYVQRMMAWLLFVPSAQWHGSRNGVAVQLGLGAASLTKYCYRVLGARTLAVELNEHVMTAAHNWFDLPYPDESEGRLSLHLGDASEWIVHAQPQSISALMVDLYDLEAKAPVLDTPDFYERCQAVLQPGGAMSVNLFYGGAFGVGGFEKSLKRICAAFATQSNPVGNFGGNTIGSVWAFEPTKEGNTIVIAVKGKDAPDAATLKLRAASVAQGTDLPARSWVKQLHRVI